MSKTRDWFQPVWKKDTPLRKERIAFAKAGLIGAAILLVGGIIPELLGIVFPQQVEWLFGIGIIGSVIGVGWTFFRIFPTLYKMSEEQKRMKREREEKNE